MKLIWEYLLCQEHGNQIEAIMKNTGLARGTVKSNLFYLMMTDNVVEYVYGQNTKIYKVKHEKYQDNGFINSVVINL